MATSLGSSVALVEDVDVANFEYWAGNPSIEIAHGHIRTAVARTADTCDTGYSCVALASSVPCHMSAPEFCEFVGAFGEDMHRMFRHCRVLHGHNPEEYLIAIWLTTAAATTALIEQYNEKQYNALEPHVCRINRVVGCQAGTLAAEEAESPSGVAGGQGLVRRRSRGLSGITNETRMCMSPPSRSPSPPCPSMMQLSLGGSMSPSLPSLPSPVSPRSKLLPTSSTDSGGMTIPYELEQLFHGCTGTAAIERQYCPVCLEQIESHPNNYQLSEVGGGVPLTILCGHTFHARCLSRWCDTTCPVCRFQQHPYRTSSCDVCGHSEGLHICLVCGFISCTVESDSHSHAQQHFEATSHTYALEVNTQRVWDYAGNGYVHRLLYNDADGKVVEHSVMEEGLSGATAAASASGAATMTSSLSDFARDGPHSSSTSKKAQKESVVSEFNALLSSQMTAQRRYYEERQKEIEVETARRLREQAMQMEDAIAATHTAQGRLDEIISSNSALEIEIADVTAGEEVVKRQGIALEGLNEKISKEQRSYEEVCEGVREKAKAARQQRAKEVEELQQQIRDLEMYVQMRRRCEASADKTDLQGAHMIVTEDTHRGRGGRRKSHRK